MSLITDKVFFNALNASGEIVGATGGRIYNTSIPVPDEQLDNEPLPYVIITYDGMKNEGMTKDGSYEGINDKVKVSILVVAEDRELLGDLVESVREQVQSYFLNIEEDADDYELVPVDYSLEASEIVYNPDAPCYFQTLSYDCDTNP